MGADLIIFGVVNLVVSVLSGASGGGGGIVSTPLMVLLGLSPAQAIATAKFSGLGLSLGASSRFFKEKITSKRTVIIFSVIGGLGALGGSITLASLQEHTELIENLMAVAILLVGVPMLYIRGAGLTARPRPTWVKALGMPILLASVFVQVALGSGIGGLQMVLFISMFGMTALVASATRRVMQLSVASVALVVFIGTGLVDYRYGMMGLVTSLVGGYVGAHVAISKGNKFVINLLAAVSIMLALQLLLK